MRANSKRPKYIACSKSFEGRMPKTEYTLRRAGRKAFEKYLDHMEALIQAMGKDNTRAMHVGDHYGW